MRCSALGIFAARLVSLQKLFLIAEIAGLDEIHDAPQIEQAVFQRRAGERDFIFAFQLLHRLRDLRAGIFDELRLVQNHRAERKFLQLLQIAPEQRVIRHDQIVLRNLFAQIVPRRAAFEHEHFQVRREFFRFAPPVVQNGRGTNHERRLVIFFVLLLQPREPRQSLQRFSETHVVGENSAEFDSDKMREKIEAVFLIRTQFRLQHFRQFDARNAFEFGNALAQFLRLGRFRKTRKFVIVQMRDIFEADFLRHGDQTFHAHVGHRLVRALHGGGVEFDPAGIRQFHKTSRRAREPFQIRLAQFQAFLLPFGGHGKPVNAAAFDDQFRLELCAA